MAHNEAACQAPRVVQIDAEFGQLCNAVAELHDSVNELQKRLSPVSVQMDESAKGGGACLAIASSPFAQELSARVASVYAARDKVRNMIHCLDI
jgi:hypothetical protein